MFNVAWVNTGVRGSIKDTENTLCVKNNSYTNFDTSTEPNYEWWMKYVTIPPSTKMWTLTWHSAGCLKGKEHNELLNYFTATSVKEPDSFLQHEYFPYISISVRPGLRFVFSVTILSIMHYVTSVETSCNGFYNLIFLPHRKHPVSIRKNNAVYTNIGYLTRG